MIAANKRLLKATLTEGVLGIQINLIQLYQANLSAVATQAALIAGFSFAAITTEFTNTYGTFSTVLSYVYYSCFTVCFCAALFALSQSTIVVMFGPSMALKADDSDAVRVASEYMRQQQVLVFNIGVVSVTALFVGACVLTWATYDYPIAAICCLVYISSFYIVVVQGAKALDIFLPTVDVTVDANLQAEASLRSGIKFFGKSLSTRADRTSSQGKDGKVKSVKDSQGRGSEMVRASSMNSAVLGDSSGGGSRADGQSEGGRSNLSSATSLRSEDPVERIRLKAKGVMWRRRALEKGGTFVRVFAVLEKGKLDFYDSEQHYINHENPINQQPVKLWQQNLETDPRKFSRSVTSLRNTLKSAILGNEDFYVADVMSSEFDLVFASKNFKFALLPKVSSELVATEITELLAHDEKSYKQWVRALSTVCDAYDEIAASPSIEHTMRAGTSDVETVVQAANVLTTKFN